MIFVYVLVFVYVGCARKYVDFYCWGYLWWGRGERGNVREGSVVVGFFQKIWEELSGRRCPGRVSFLEEYVLKGKTRCGTVCEGVLLGGQLSGGNCPAGICRSPSCEPILLVYTEGVKQCFVFNQTLPCSFITEVWLCTYDRELRCCFLCISLFKYPQRSSI